MLSENEKIILTNLRNDSRTSLAEISRKHQVPVPTLYQTLQRLENSGIIHRHASMLDFRAIGFNTRVAMAIKAEKKQDLLKHLSNCQNINSLHKVTNDFDFFAEGVFRNLADYERFKESLEPFRLKRFIEHHIVEELKREQADVF
jgi:DNA-binding Lrp family transcriptional regulator